MKKCSFLLAIILMILNFFLLFTDASYAASSNAESLHEKVNAGDRHALEQLTAQANNGDPDAQFHLALIYDYSEIMPPDSEKAIYWYQKAAEGGNEKASFALGWLYQGGRSDIPQNAELSLAWYQKAAEQGNADGMNFMGKAEMEKKNYVSAYAWFLLAERRGDKTFIGGVNSLPFVRGMTPQQIQDAKKKADEWQIKK